MKIRKIETLKANKKKQIKKFLFFHFILKTPYRSIYSQNFTDGNPELFLSASKVGYIVNFVKSKISKNFKNFIIKLFLLSVSFFFSLSNWKKKLKTDFFLILFMKICKIETLKANKKKRRSHRKKLFFNFILKTPYWSIKS